MPTRRPSHLELAVELQREAQLLVDGIDCAVVLGGIEQQLREMVPDASSLPTRADLVYVEHNIAKCLDGLAVERHGPRHADIARSAVQLPAHARRA